MAGLRATRGVSHLAAPDVMRLVRQSGWHADCGVSALAMLCGVLYEDALAAFADPIGVLTKGVEWDQLRMAAAKFMVPVKVSRKYDITEDTGILRLTGKKGKDDHLVFLWAGRIIEGSGELWKEPDDYLKHYCYKAGGLMVRTDVD